MIRDMAFTKVEAIHTGELEFSQLTLPCDCHVGDIVNSIKAFRRFFFKNTSQNSWISLHISATNEKCLLRSYRSTAYISTYGGPGLYNYRWAMST